MYIQELQVLLNSQVNHKMKDALHSLLSIVILATGPGACDWRRIHREHPARHPRGPWLLYTAQLLEHPALVPVATTGKERDYRGLLTWMVVERCMFCMKPVHSRKAATAVQAGSIQ